MKKRSVKIAGHSTSVSLEDEFWTALQDCAAREGVSLNRLIARIDEAHPEANLSSALRLYILRDLQTRLEKTVPNSPEGYSA